MTRVSWGSFSASVVLVLGAWLFVGCNKILDNTPGSLATSEEAGTLPNDDTPGSSTGPGGRPDASTSTGDGGKPPIECTAGKKACHGMCVSENDPNYGCGNADCTPCSSANGTMACSGGKCVVAKCDPGYADCNDAPADGCETSLTKPTSCGSCTTTCPADAKFCIPMATTAQCANGCPANAPLECEGECVNSQTSASHCGGCNQRCPAVPNATSTCVGGACGFACRPMFHACGETCALDTDPAACGAACTVCPVPAGGMATCVDGACGATCPPGSHLCGDRCVTNDPTACGAACTVCPAPAGGTATCVNDVCGSSCPVGSNLCAGRCATNDPTACGPACTVCPVPAGGAATCMNGVCGSGCPAGTNLCGGACVASSANACGPACTVCPARPNATATCAGDACGFTCSASFGDCDGNPGNGCEAAFASDPLNCGACGVSCLGQPCVGGVCQVAPPP